MGVDIATLEQWLGQPESAVLEFKEARHGFNFNEVERYLAALANEGGGNVVNVEADVGSLKTEHPLTAIDHQSALNPVP